MTKLTRKTFLCTETQLEMLDLLQEKEGVKNKSVIFDMALSHFYRSIFKYGTDPLATGRASLTEDIDKIAKRKVKLKLAEDKAKRDIADEPKIQICLTDLNGKITEDNNGNKYCEWQTHTPTTSDDQKLPIFQIGEYLIGNQYIPTKTAVLKARPTLKTKKK